MPSAKLYPGICDFHVHVGERIGGYALRDGFAALERMAEQHGIAAIGAFVTEEEGISLSAKLRAMQAEAQKHFRGLVHWHLTPITATPEELVPLLKEGCDIKLYTTYQGAGLYSSYQRIGFWMEELAELKPRILVHCEDDALINAASAKYPFRTPFVHTLRRPELAEARAVDRVLNLAVKHASPVHIVHVSTPGAAMLIQEAKADHPCITCETAPHYLLYNEAKLQGPDAHRWLCSPPLRSEESRGLLVELLQDGVFDIIASDHCAFTPEDKDRFRDTPAKVPSGIPGLETLFSALYQQLVQPGTLSLERLVDLCCRKPAELMGLSTSPTYTLQQLLGQEDEHKHG